MFLRFMGYIDSRLFYKYGGRAPYIGRFEQQGAYQLHGVGYITIFRYATNASSSWVTSTLHYAGTTYGGSIAIDSNIKVHIAYQEATRAFSTIPRMPQAHGHIKDTK